ncbi:GAF domain-containing protein [Mariprofundus aestuarium]|uniref:GAF domain-containing protein n=1 Tax=Mariprofundus aestuarium TaxID=1921086 RepID=A0A2K8L016_MARES|nr:GAF domain-containing protein [Mariprofundus aestuarium]
MVSPSAPLTLDIPDRKLSTWQRIADLLASSSGVPAALIMRVHPSEIEVFISSHSAGNPYKQNERAQLNSGLYCETVMSTGEPLLVPDALSDPEWNHNPDIELGMVYYLGFPLRWPNGETFGTVCVLDRENNQKATSNGELMALLAKIIESDLEGVFEVAELKRSLEHLQAQLP